MTGPSLLVVASGICSNGAVSVGSCAAGDNIVVIQGQEYGGGLATMPTPAQSGSASLSSWQAIGQVNNDWSAIKAWRATVNGAGTVTVATGTDGTVHVFRVGGVDAATPLDGGMVSHGDVQGSGGTSQSVGPLTLNTPDALIFGCWGGAEFAGDLVFTAPAGMTKRADNTRETGSVWTRQMTATVQATAIGSSGVKTATTNYALNYSWSGILFAIRGEQNKIVAPSGIVTAETFGRPAMYPGLVTVGPAPGIAGGETFGTFTIGPAQSIGPVGAVASAETFGAATVTPGLHTISPAGAASVAAFGAATMVPGVASVGPAPGVVSGELFGSPRIGYGFATTDLPRAYPRLATPPPAVAYELVCVARIPQTQGPPTFLEVDPINWSGLSYTEELSAPSTLQAGCKISGLTDSIIERLRSLATLATELWLYRAGRQIYAGPLMGWQVQGQTLTLQSKGLLSYLDYWFIIADTVFKQVDQHLIVKALVNQWQTLDYGHFGINTEHITPSGMLRDAIYLQKELNNVGQRVGEMGKRQNGFDVRVDPASRDLQLWYPNQGVDRSTGEDAMIFDDRNVTSPNILCSAAPGDVASDAFGTGTGGVAALYSAKANADLRATFGRTGVAQSFNGVSEQGTCDAYTQGLIDARGAALLVPGPDVRTTSDSDLAAYDVGDTVDYELHQQLGLTGNFRLRKRTVSVAATGREKITIQFV